MHPKHNRHIITVLQLSYAPLFPLQIALSVVTKFRSFSLEEPV
jgi:hypothetical protein